MSFYKREDKIWQYDKVIDGRRITISGEVREKRAAWKIVQRKLDALSERQHRVSTDVVVPASGSASNPPSTDAVSLDMIRTKYLAVSEGKFKSPHNFRRHRNYVNKLVERLGPARELYSITHSDLLPIIQELERGEKPRKAGTINAQVLQVMRPMFKHAHLTLQISRLCMVNWKLVARSEDLTRVRYLRRDEMARLLAAAPDRDGYMHQFAWITGFRVSEIINLRWSDIDWDNRLITTRVKGGRLHTVPLTRKLENLVRAVQPEGHPTYIFTFKSEVTNSAFNHIKGLRYKFSYGYLYSRFRTTVEAAGIEDYRFHDHRHTAATLVLLATCNIRLVQALLGHRNIQSCERYAHLNVGVVARELERMDATDLPHAAMAELLASAGMETDDVLRMEDVLRDNIKLLRQMAQLVDENRELRRAAASAAA